MSVCSQLKVFHGGTPTTITLSTALSQRFLTVAVKMLNLNIFESPVPNDNPTPFFDLQYSTVQ